MSVLPVAKNTPYKLFAAACKVCFTDASILRRTTYYVIPGDFLQNHFNKKVTGGTYGQRIRSTV